MKNNLFVCNTYSDSISIIDLDMFREVGRVNLNDFHLDRIGPRGICLYKNKLLVANNYSNSISIIDINKREIQNDFFIGMRCNDVKVCGDKAFVICSDSNKIIKYNIEKEQLEEQIPCGDMPYSIDLYKPKQLIITANMNNDSITMVDYDKYENIRQIRVGNYPTKALFGIDANNIFICESNIGSDQCGSISILSSKDLRVLYRIPVGNTPIDMCIEQNLCFVTNFGEGTVSVVDLNKCIELDRIEIGGMPKGILAYKGNIYVGDSYNNILFSIDLLKKNKRTLKVGREPSGMLLS